MPEDVCEGEADLCEGETFSVGYSLAFNPQGMRGVYLEAPGGVEKRGRAHFLPMQFLAPMENGCTTSRLSFSKCSLPSQREGAKMSGELKLRREWLAAY